MCCFDLQDFYIDDHWNKLPISWRQHFEQLPVEQLCALLQVEADIAAGARVVWPLELLALREVLRMLSISRTPKTHLDVGKLAQLDAIYSLL